MPTVQAEELRGDDTQAATVIPRPMADQEFCPSIAALKKAYRESFADKRDVLNCLIRAVISSATWKSQP
jgi:hypothetical protein